MRIMVHYFNIEKDTGFRVGRETGDVVHIEENYYKMDKLIKDQHNGNYLSVMFFYKDNEIYYKLAEISHDQIPLIENQCKCSVLDRVKTVNSDLIGAIESNTLEAFVKLEKSNYLNEQQDREDKRLEKTKQYEAMKEKERLERLENTKNAILSGQYVSGSHFLLLIAELNIDCPLRTKGLINRFSDFRFTVKDKGIVSLCGATKHNKAFRFSRTFYAVYQQVLSKIL